MSSLPPKILLLPDHVVVLKDLKILVNYMNELSTNREVFTISKF